MFLALGEPSRLRIVELLRSRPFGVGEIADALGIRQPQVSKHLRTLSEAGLVSAETRARHRIYRLERAAFDDVSHWIASFERTWDERLDALGRYLAASPDSHTEPTTTTPPEDR